VHTRPGQWGLALGLQQQTQGGQARPQTCRSVLQIVYGRLTHNVICYISIG
jgi:hypothetical protein